MRLLKSSIGQRDFISLDDVCYLISITTTQDTLGQAIKEEKESMVFCSKMSITRAEFNSAGMLGKKTSLMFIIDADTYEEEQLLRYNEKKYSIYKTFQRADGFTEIYCEVKAGD